MNFRQLVFLSVAHFLVDAYASVFGPLAAIVRMDAARIGVLGTLFGASTAFAQLPFGYLSDRTSLRRYASAGLVSAALFLSLAGPAAHSPGVLAVCLLVGGTGVAAFHPAAVVLAARSVPERSGVAVSLFVTLGTIGFSLGPLFFVLFVARFELASTPWLAAAGLLFAPVLHRSIPAPPARSRGTASFSSRAAAVRVFLRCHGGALLPLYLLVVFRSAVQIVLTQFAPRLMVEWGHGETVASLTNTTFIAGGALGMFVCGIVAGRWNRRWLQGLSLVLGVPPAVAFLQFPALPAAVLLGLLAVAGFFVLSTTTMHIVMGQEIAPDHAGTVSSIVMGFGWGVGSIGSYVAGALAARVGLVGALTLVCLSALATLPLTAFLRPRPSARAAAAGATILTTT